MTNTLRIELVYFEGCPNALQARANITAAIEASGHDVGCFEWDLMAESTPEVFRRYGSPTILVDGRDVTGEGPGNSAVACRSDGVPSIATIAEKLQAPSLD